MKQPLISGLDDGVLERLLDELKRSPTIHDAYAEVVQNLQIHQVELEQQNRELREIQQALELSRDRYAELYERAPVGYATLNRVGTVKQINLPGALLLETERARIVGTSLGRFLQRGQRRALLNHLAQVMDSNESRSLELTLHCDTGPPRVLRLTTDHAHLENGEPVCHVVILNVTEERRAKDALHESVRLIERAHMEWREAFDAIHDPIFLHDAQGRIVRANQAYAAAGGADVKTLPGRRYWEVFPKSDRPMPGCSAAVSGRHDTSESNAEIELDDGRTFHNRNFAARDSKGNFQYCVHVMDDITALKQAERKIATERTFLQTIIDGIADPIAVIDADHNVLMVNSAARRDTEAESVRAAGAGYPGLIHRGSQPAQDAGYPYRLDDVIASGGSEKVVHRQRGTDGQLRTIELSVSPLRNDDGDVVGVIEASRDISEHLLLLDELKQRELQLAHLAQHDPLTALPNRLLFIDRLSQAVHRAHRMRKKVGLLFVDLDRFKKLNDGFGHPAGDRVLKQVAQRLCGLFREDDTVARLGGDEFTVVLSSVEGPQDAGLVAQKILDVFKQPFQIEHQSLYMTASVGISIYPDDGANVDTLVKNADAAMYRAKEQGRDTFQYYTQDMTTLAFEHVILESSLRRAIVNEEFVLHYQPQVDMLSGRTIGIESLVRWNHPDLGLLLPNRFMSVAEETGIIEAVGDWVLHTACAQLRKWREEGLASNLTVKVNLSKRQLEDASLVKTVGRALRRSGLDPQALAFEITETMILIDQQRAEDTLSSLCGIGTNIAIDDFGTGYSSLSQLKSLPVNELKIDKSFVTDISSDENDVAITRAIVGLGESLNLRVIAEGIETEEQASILQRMGCRHGQGYYYCRPIPADQMRLYLRDIRG